MKASDSAVPPRTFSWTSSSTALKTGIGEPHPEDVERLDQRHAGFEQGRQLLVEYQKLVPGDLVAPPLQAEPAQPAARAERQDVQPFVFELAAERDLALGDVDALDDFARRGAEAAAKLHP